MGKKVFPFILVVVVGMLCVETGIEAQESPNFQVVVNMVQLNVAVTDKKGNYITGLRPPGFLHHGRWHCGENGHLRRRR